MVLETSAALEKTTAGAGACVGVDVGKGNIGSIGKNWRSRRLAAGGGVWRCRCGKLYGRRWQSRRRWKKMAAGKSVNL